jgi:tellurite resistance protein
MSAEESWTLFSDRTSGDALPAVAGAFALVACVDAEVTDTEIERFVEQLRQNRAFSGVDLDGLEQQFRQLSAAVLEDFESGRKRAIEAIRRVHGDTEVASQVVRAAQVALVADGQLHSAEEVILAEICTVLGLDPAAY